MKTTLEINRRKTFKPSRNGLKYFVKTFGCQMNEHDSERIAGLFEQDGMIKANSIDDSDILFVNTCTIRENADDKLYGTLGQLKVWKNNSSNRKLLVGGCAAQKDKELVRNKAPWVDVVIGTHNLTDVVHLLNQSEDWGPITEVKDNIETLPTEAPSIRESEVSALVTIQIGCDNSCTFCIVPSVRGPEISRRPSDILNEVTNLVESGVKEVTLLGQNVNSYGRDLKINGKSKPYFSELLHILNDVEDLKRIRFTSPHPKDFKEVTLNSVNILDKVTNQIHIPLQSGSNSILRKMQRGYNQQKFLQKVDLAKNTIKDVQQAECNLEPLHCLNCDSTEVTYHQYIGDAYCSDCGEWQEDISDRERLRKENLIEAIVSLNDEDSVHFCNKWDLTHYGEERATDHLYNYAKNVVEGECKTIEDIKDMENYLNKYKLNK